MNLPKLKDVVEMLGLTAVLVGMYFVYAEIRQNGTIARLEMATSIRERLDGVVREQLDPEFAELYRKGIQNPAELTETERLTLNAYFESLMGLMAAEFNTHRLGLFVEYENFARQVARQYLGQGYGRAFWNARKSSFYPQVVAIVDDELSKTSGNSYRDFDDEILKQIASP